MMPKEQPYRNRENADHSFCSLGRRKIEFPHAFLPGPFMMKTLNQSKQKYFNRFSKLSRKSAIKNLGEGEESSIYLARVPTTYPDAVQNSIASFSNANFPFFNFA
jgi:hypothetical protein